MSLFFAVEAIAAVTRVIPIASATRARAPENRDSFVAGFNRLLLLMGIAEELPRDGDPEARLWVPLVRDMCKRFYVQALQYVQRLAFSRDVLAYNGPLLSYMEFLLPLLKLIRSLSFLPDGPMFLLIDDADKLSLTQTKVLNSWVSSRTSDEVSIKVSTQMQYKTHRTTASTTIDSTHDFSEVNISDIYTSSKGKYLSRVREIVQKRLRKYGVRNSNGETPSAEEFFPVYSKQEEEIEKIREELRSNFDTEGRGFRASDDVVRYAVPSTWPALLDNGSHHRSTYMLASNNSSIFRLELSGTFSSLRRTCLARFRLTPPTQ